jgi:uncharacterized protein (DUF3084 family)
MVTAGCKVLVYALFRVDGSCVCCVLPCCCSAADARAAELSAAAECLDQRGADLEGREAAVQAATADLEGREQVLAQQKTEMAAQEVRPDCKHMSASAHGLAL